MVTKEMEAKTDEEKYRPVIVWKNVFKFSVLHALGINGLLLFQTVAPETVIFSIILWIVACVVSVTFAISTMSVKALF